ncbi:hypothetical protein [Streptomyces sp.]|uniref:hypothetical protein n=1 Tax=Streptomyces sp. TaxID=1931 RepID=UPI002F9563EE
MRRRVFFHIRFARRGRMPELLDSLGRFTPLVQQLPPVVVMAQMAGALRQFRG